MGRRRRSGNVKPRDFTNRRLLSNFNVLSLIRPLIEIEDRRTFHPERDLRPARSFSRALHRLVVAPRPVARRKERAAVAASLPQRVAFENPRKVLICVRRKIRTEVIHALGKAGRGAKRKSTSRRNEYSDVGC